MNRTVPSHRLFAIAAVWTALALTAATAQSAPINDTYFPMHQGNLWVFQVATEAPTLSARDSATNAAFPTYPQVVGAALENDLSGMRVAYLDNFFFSTGRASLDARFANDDEGVTRLAAAGTFEAYLPWVDVNVDFDLPTSAGTCLAGTTGRFRTSGTVQVPAGTFHDTITIDYTGQPCGDSGLVSETYAPHVGLIQRTVLSFAGEIRWELTLAQVNGDVHAGAPQNELARRQPTLDRRAIAPSASPVALEQATWGRVKDHFGR